MDRKGHGCWRSPALLAALVFLQACWHPGSEVQEVALQSPPAAIESVLIRGGTVVRRGAPDERLDLLVERQDGYLVLTGAGQNGGYSARDTIDATSLYIHSANHFEATVEITPPLRSGRLSVAMYVLRTGRSPGTPARWLVGPHEVRQVKQAENHPAAPVDDRVGCYTLERGRWSDPEFDFDQSRMPVWFPDSLQLHWQYHWPVGPDPYLVATDASGNVRGERISYYAWAPIPPDSLRVSFGVWYVATTFRGSALDQDHVGELSIFTDSGFSVRAPAHLRRVECPDEERTLR